MKAPEKISIRKALNMGHIRLSLPIFLLCAIVFIPAFISLNKGDISHLTYLGLILATGVPSWLYWSIAAPYFRIWAYQRVENLDEFLEKSTKEFLIYKETNFFTKTEIRTAAQKKEIARLVAEWEQRKKDNDPNGDNFIFS